MTRRAFESLAGRESRRTSLAQIRTWLVWTALLSILVGGCAGMLDVQRQEPAAASAGSSVRQVSVKETTVSGWDNGWSVGVEWISNGHYVDADGNARRGRVARLSVWNDALGQADTLDVYEGMVFSIGEQRFQVIKLKPNRSLRRVPGSSNGYVVIGQLEEGAAAALETASMGLTVSTIGRLFEEGSAHIYRQGGSETIDLYCHVVEGSWCYFVPQDGIKPYESQYDPQIEDEAYRIESDFARQITRELGVEIIAHSRNNGVYVRCIRPENARSPLGCQVDRGGGWQEQPILK